MDTSGASRRTLIGGDSDRLVAEAPLALVVDDARVVTIRTPTGADDDEAWARGFLLGEGIVASPDDVLALTTGTGDDGIPEIRAEVRDGDGDGDARRLARAHEIRPSCGLCGSLGGEGLSVDGPMPIAGRPRVSLAAVAAMVDDMSRNQTVFEATGACHAAALYAASGRRLSLAEDVGRHNAVDKAVGRALMAGHATELGQSVGTLSGRAGFELVAKLIRAGLPVIASVSAPTALAFDLCKEAGTTLLGFVRDGRGRIYWDADRIS